MIAAVAGAARDIFRRGKHLRMEGGQCHDFTLEVDRHEGIVENKYRDGTFSPH